MPPKKGGTFKFVSISVVGLCDGASWCERAAGLVTGRLLAIAQAPFSVDSLTVLAGMALVIAAEIVVLGYAKSSLYRLLHPTKSTRADIVWFLVRIFGLQSLVVAVASLGLTTFSNQLAMKYAGLHVLAKIKDPVLQGVVFVVAFDFISYWVHRGRHAFGWWWEFHKHHHSATEFNAITQARTHPLDGVATALSTVVLVHRSILRWGIASITPLCPSTKTRTSARFFPYGIGCSGPTTRATWSTRRSVSRTTIKTPTAFFSTSPNRRGGRGDR